MSRATWLLPVGARRRRVVIGPIARYGIRRSLSESDDAPRTDGESSPTTITLGMISHASCLSGEGEGGKCYLFYCSCLSYVQSQDLL